VSNFYKIEGESEFAYFRANIDQLQRIFESDPNWVAGVMEIAQHYGLTKIMQGLRNSLFGCKVEARGTNYFEVRGTVSLYYRVEAVSDSVSRILPLAKLMTAHKIWIPIQLALACIIPIIFTPLMYKAQKNKTVWYSKAHLEPLCQYLEIRGQQIYGQRQQGEIKQ